jgi:elongation factor 1-gamma
MSDSETEDVKVTHPLSLLPQAKMALDECKRKYYEHKKVGTKYFGLEIAKDFDADGYTLYRSEYKYNSDFDGRMDFVNRNSVDGFVQGFDKSVSKYVFGVLVLTKNNDKYEVTGYWILRGTVPMKEVFEDFVGDNTWTKLEANDDTFKLFDNVFYFDGTLENVSIEHRKLVL